jgi:hypothetical protein
MNWVFRLFLTCVAGLLINLLVLSPDLWLDMDMFLQVTILLVYFSNYFVFVSIVVVVRTTYG